MLITIHFARTEGGITFLGTGGATPELLSSVMSVSASLSYALTSIPKNAYMVD